ncbi:MAG: DUF362 domain-containing protein [Candidatus Kariarchaeaceae archaeon]|jgi:uncharacterized Fe-S center protein
MDPSKVYYGSLLHGKNSPSAAIATKLDKIIELLDFSTIEKKDKVAIKMHLGFRDGYQTVPVFFVRRVVQAVKDAGGYPFVTDNPTAVYNAVNRGYTQETCGCPIVPIAGIKDEYKYETKIDYQGVDSLDMCGALHDADVLIDLTHSKGHGCNGYGGAIKNLALGAYTGPTRWKKIHGIEQSIPYWNPEKCTPEHAKFMVENCPYDAMKYDEDKNELKIAFCMCKSCMECVNDSDHDCLQIKQENFSAFQEMMAISTKHVVDTFDKDKRFYLNFALQITASCDCMGMGMPVVVNDIGILGSRDIVSVDVATLDLINKSGLIYEAVPPVFKHVNTDTTLKMHPFQRIHGPMKDPYICLDYAEKLEMGSTKYELVEVLSPEEVMKVESKPHQFETEPTFF